jgi:MraZ protein
VFVGTHERQLDTKGRVALPASYRSRFDEKVFLAFGKTGCIDAYTPTEFDRMAKEMVAKQERGEADLDEVRALFFNTYEADVDGQGRVVLAAPLRDYAGMALGSPIVVAGAWNHLELWNPEQFAAVNKRGATRRSAAG